MVHICTFQKGTAPVRDFVPFFFFLSVPYSDRLLLFWVCGTEMFGKLLAFCSYESSVVSCWRLKLHWSVLCKPFSYLLFTSVLQGCNFDLLIWLQLAVLKKLNVPLKIAAFPKSCMTHWFFIDVCPEWLCLFWAADVCNVSRCVLCFC